MDPFLLLEHDGLNIVVRQSRRGGAARVAGADDHDFGGEDLCGIRLCVVVGVGEERRLFARIVPVETACFGHGGMGQAQTGQGQRGGACRGALQEVATCDLVCHVFSSL